MKSKLPETGITIFTIMSALANENRAINLSQGFPDFTVSQELISLVNSYMKKGFNQYAPMMGIMELREVIAEKIYSIYGVNYNPETEITVTSGGTEALYAAIASVVQTSDEVIIFEPAYDSYAPAVKLNGGVPKYITLEPPEYKVDWQEVKANISEKTRLVIINSPHNPCGTVLGKGDLESLKNIIKGREIYILSDEVYEHIVFDGMDHNSMMSVPELKERSFIVSSFGKTFHVTGWKVGYCVAPKSLSAEFRKVHQFLTFCTFTPVQHAIKDFLRNPENYIHVSELYEKKRDIFLDTVSGSGFTFTPARGTYFQNLCYSGICNENDYELAVRLTKEKGVASVPVSAFYHDKRDYKMLRFCFAKNDEILIKAGKKIAEL